jgi:hypothetical protein
MKTLTKEAAVATLVRLYTKRLHALNAKGLRGEFAAIFGEETPATRAETIDELVRDYEEWIGSLEPLELEAVWEDQEGVAVRITDASEIRQLRRKVA